MKLVIIAATLLAAAANPAFAQPSQKIKLVLEVHSEGADSRDSVTPGLTNEVRRGLESIVDVELVPSGQSRRMIWIVAGSTPGFYAASLMITERYDRETLMVLGIEDDDMAERMMALQIVNDHQIFTGSDAADVARRIVASIDAGVLARLRTRPPKP